MRCSIQIPTCTEGLVNPIPCAGPADFVRLAQAAERLGYDAVCLGQRPHHGGALRPDHVERDIVPRP